MNKSLQQLLGTNQGVEATPTNERPPEEPKEVERAMTATETALHKKYNNFEAMCNAIAASDEANTSSDNPNDIPDIIIGCPKLFGLHIFNVDRLVKLVGMRPHKIEACIDNILSIPECAIWFLTDFLSLAQLTSKFPTYKARILNYVFTQPAIYSQLIICKSTVLSAFEHLPECETRVLDILAKDVEIFTKCVANDLEFFLFLYRRNTEYSERFFLHFITNDAVFETVAGIMCLHKVLTELSTEAQDRVMKSVLTSDTRFESQFPGFAFIYDFEKKYPSHPHYIEKLFAKGLTVPNYVRRQVSHVNALFRLHKENADHAQQVETLVVQDSEWVLDVITYTEDVKALCESDQFVRLKAVFLNFVYLCPKSFNSHVDDASDLDAMIAIVPEHANKLRLYFQFYQLLFVKGFSLRLEARNATYRDANTMAELTQAIDLNFKKGTLDKNVAKPLNEVVGSLLEATENGTDQYEALSQLKSVLDSMLALNVTGLLAEKVSKDLQPNTQDAPASEQIGGSFKSSPGRTSSE